jgi:hypothetical protein
VDAEGEIFARLEEIEFPFEEKGVGAEVDITLLGDEAFNDAVDFRVDEGLPARDRDHGGSTFLGGGPALFRREPFVENVVGILDFAATGAGEVATEKGFEHEDQRIVAVAFQLLTDDITRNGPRLGNRDGHKTVKNTGFAGAVNHHQGHDKSLFVRGL